MLKFSARKVLNDPESDQPPKDEALCFLPEIPPNINCNGVAFRGEVIVSRHAPR